MVQFNTVKESYREIRYITIPINSIIEDIGDGKRNFKEGLAAIVKQIEQGVDSIYSILDTSYSLKDTIFDLVELLSGNCRGSVDTVVDKAEETIDGFVEK
jgi:hypothetical protein